MSLKRYFLLTHSNLIFLCRVENLWDVMMLKPFWNILEPASLSALEKLGDWLILYFIVKNVDLLTVNQVQMKLTSYRQNWKSHCFLCFKQIAENPKIR